MKGLTEKEIVPPHFEDFISERIDKEVSSHKIEALQAKLEASERVKAKWWEDWTKPAPILAVAGILWGIFSVYQSDKANLITSISDLRNSITALNKQVADNFEASNERSRKYIPAIEKNTAALAMQEILNKQLQDRNDSTVQSLQILRQSIEGLRDIQAKDHDELLMQKSRREGRSGPFDPPVKKDPA